MLRVPHYFMQQLNSQVWRRYSTEEAMVWKLGELKTKVTAMSLGVISF